MALAQPARSVLIIEDEQGPRELYAKLLGHAGFDVVEARTGTEGFTRACEARPDLILTDLGLPGINGWELIRLLKADSRTRDIPVVVVTGWSTPTLRDLAAKLGCASLLSKPCPPDELIAELEKTLDRFDKSERRD
jgi:two-component system phosphate regulon response regulator PhoB